MPTDLRLATLADLKLQLLIAPGDPGRDTTLAALLDRVSRIIERFCNRNLIKRAAYTEYHTLDESRSRIWTLDFPIVAITSIHESTDQTYDSTTLLVDSTDYVAHKGEGRITRVSGSSRISWDAGFERSIKLIYTAGYDDDANTKTNIPDDVQDVCLRLAAIGYREIEEKLQGLSERTAVGGAQIRGLTRELSSAHLTESMQDQLQAFVKMDRIPTGERD